MKILMHWDMEGTSGLFEREQTWFWERGTRESKWREGRELLMADINSASAAVVLTLETAKTSWAAVVSRVTGGHRSPFRGREVGP